MDPLVFNIITSDSESASSTAMKSHPGDCAAPLDILEWLDKFDEKIESTSYGQVRRGQVPAALSQLVVPPVANLELRPISELFGGSGGRIKRWEQLDREVLLDRESAWWILAASNAEQRVLREQLLTILAEA